MVIMLTLLTGCDISVNDTSMNDEPSTLYKNNPNIDMFVYRDIAYVNAEDVEWVNELNKEKDELIGKIKRTKEDKNFKEFSAIKLPVGTKIYSIKDRSDILLVEINGQLYPYLAWIEG